MRYKFSFLFFLIILIGCKNDKINPKLIENNWKIERDSYAKGTLTINENNTFKFIEKSHTSETYSNGNWIIKNDTLILNSKSATECLYVDNFNSYCEDKYIVVKEKVETTIENCTPKNFTKFYTEFRNEKFILSKDSLNYINPNKNCLNQQFDYKIYKWK